MRGEKIDRRLYPSLRRHYPDQVLRVFSQPFCYGQNSTPRNLPQRYEKCSCAMIPIFSTCPVTFELPASSHFQSCAAPGPAV